MENLSLDTQLFLWLPIFWIKLGICLIQVLPAFGVPGRTGPTENGWKVRLTGLPGLAFSRPKNDKFGLFYIGWPGHFLEFIKYLAFFKVYRRFYSEIKTFFLF